MAAVGLLALACGRGACSSGDPTCGDHAAVQPAVQGVSIIGDPGPMRVGQTAQLTAVVAVTGGATQAVAWSSDNPGIVSATGANSATVTAIAPGVATITARSQADATKFATVAITVSGPPPVAQWTAMRISPLDVSIAGDVTCMWGTSSTNVYAGTSAGNIVRYDGVSWQPSLAGKGSFNSIFGNTPADIFAVGASTSGTPSIWHFDGATWTSQAAPGTAPLWSVWSPGTPSVAYAVGERGTILRFGGTSWSAMASPTTQTLYSVWGLAASDVYAVGDNGTIIHFDGAAWSSMTSGTAVDLSAVWASGPTNVFVVGPAGLILRFNGVSWSPMSSGTTQFLGSIHGSSATQAYIVGAAGTLLTFNGTSWTPSTLLFDQLGFNFGSVWDGGAAGVFIGGRNGLTVRSGAGQATMLSYSLTYFAVGGAGSTAYVTDDLHDIYRFDGAGWTAMTNPSHVQVFAVSPPFAVGEFGLVMQLNGNDWSMVQTPVTKLPNGPRLFGVAALSPTDAIAAGDAGTILKLTGTTWTVQASGTTASLRGVWYRADGKAAYAVGQGGIILRYDGASWTRMTSPVTTTLQAVWSPASDPANPTAVPNVYAVGVDGSILVNTAGGAAWSVLRAPTNIALNALWGTGPADILAVGNQGTVLRFDGASWTSMTSGVNASLNGAGGFAGNGVFAVGSGGTALHGTPSGSLPMPMERRWLRPAFRKPEF